MCIAQHVNKKAGPPRYKKSCHTKSVWQRSVAYSHDSIVFLKDPDHILFFIVILIIVLFFSIFFVFRISLFLSIFFMSILPGVLTHSLC